MNIEKSLVINDLHIPWENTRAIDLTLRIGQLLDPDIIYINGDLMDCWEISKYVKDPKWQTKANIAYEVERTRGFLKELRHKFPLAKIIWIFGNHEYRWYVHIAANAKELYGLKGMTLEEQVETKEQRIEVVNNGTKENSYQYGKLLIGHFDKVSQHSAYTAKSLLEKHGISLIQAHTHRGGASYKRMFDHDIVAYENFCLCDRNPGYANKPNWQLGFSIIYKDKDSDYFRVSQHYIEEKLIGKRLVYKTEFNGKIHFN